MSNVLCAAVLLLEACGESDDRRLISTPKPHDGSTFDGGGGIIADGRLDGGVEADMSAAAVFEHTWILGAKDASEVDLDMKAGSVVTADFDATYSLLWNVHSHPEGDVEVYDNGVNAMGSVIFTAPSAGTFSYYWEVPDTATEAVTLNVTVTGQATVYAFYPP